MRGDAIAASIMVITTWVGGLFVGVLQHGMGMGQRLKAIRC